jgi:predicted ribonuclease YlaK
MKKSNGLDVLPEELNHFEAMTPNQKIAFDKWDEGSNLALIGSAGTGKTFLALYFAFKALMENPDVYRQVLILRSVVPTRDMGFLPGTTDEKKDPFITPYKLICEELFFPKAYSKLSNRGKLHFETTSYIRGCTYDNTILVVDEMQNCNFHELDSIITRVGHDCRLIFAGDYAQTDFKNEKEANGILQFLRIIEQMPAFRIVEFEWSDIVRSGLVRDYIMTKEMIENER